jgi:hypothetical protein
MTTNTGAMRAVKCPGCGLFFPSPEDVRASGMTPIADEFVTECRHVVSDHIADAEAPDQIRAILAAASKGEGA